MKLAAIRLWPGSAFTGCSREGISSVVTFGGSPSSLESRNQEIFSES
jgi:hypothetical protein